MSKRPVNNIAANGKETMTTLKPEIAEFPSGPLSVPASYTEFHPYQHFSPINETIFSKYRDMSISKAVAKIVKCGDSTPVLKTNSPEFYIRKLMNRN